MRKVEIDWRLVWCSIGMDAALIFRCTEFSVALATLCSGILTVVHLVKTVAAFFSYGDLREAFGRLLTAAALFVLCNAIFRVYDRWLKWRIEEKYEINRLTNYSELHLLRSRSRLLNALVLIEVLVIVSVALTPGVGICYGLYLVIVGSGRAVAALFLSVLAEVLLCRLSLRTCAVAWRRM